VTAQSTFELQPVLDAVITNATRLAGAENGFIYQLDGEVLRIDPDFEYARTNLRVARERLAAAGQR